MRVPKTFCQIYYFIYIFLLLTIITSLLLSRVVCDKFDDDWGHIAL